MKFGKQCYILRSGRGSRWYYNGSRKLHRINGPAIEHYDGEDKYFLNGIEFSRTDYEERIKAKGLI